MIIIRNSGNLMQLVGMTTDLVATPMGKLQALPITDDRDFKTCCYSNIVLTDGTGTGSLKNDISSFMFKCTTNSDTFTLQLFKDDTFLADLNDDNYGTFYDLGSIIYYLDQALMFGYTIDWTKVYNAEGEGNYKIVAVITSFGVDTTIASVNYKLMLYSQDNVEGTFRIYSKMNGYLMRTDMNYKGLNLPDMIRVPGFFGNATESLTITSDLFTTLNGDKRSVEVRKVNKIDIYQLYTLPLPKCIADSIINYHFLANEIYITDYNNINYDYSLNNIKVYKDEAFDFSYGMNNRLVIIRGKLKEAIQDNQKTNYF